MATKKTTFSTTETRPPVGTRSNSGTASGTSASSAGSSTGLGQADVGAIYRSAGAETQSDIGQAEAYAINLKRLVADELDHDQFVRANRERLIRNGEDQDQSHRDQATRLIEATLQAVQANAALQAKLNEQYLAYTAALQATAISERERTVRIGDVASDQMWTSSGAFDAIVEVSVAKTLSKLGVKPA